MTSAAMFLQLVLSVTDAAGGLADRYEASQQVQVQSAEMRSSMVDFAMETVRCYHPSSRFRGVDFLGKSWPYQDKYGATSSAVIRIHFTGITSTPYQMTIAALANGTRLRTFVLSENALIPYNKNCQLERWVDTVHTPS
jgi:hypothetical protein